MHLGPLSQCPGLDCDMSGDQAVQERALAQCPEATQQRELESPVYDSALLCSGEIN